jgi:hypothetical protein
MRRWKGSMAGELQRERQRERGSCRERERQKEREGETERERQRERDRVGSSGIEEGYFDLHCLQAGHETD